MTNSLAIWLALAIALAVGADLVLNDGTWLIFLARKGLDLMEWIAFWR